MTYESLRCRTPCYALRCSSRTIVPLHKRTPPGIRPERKNEVSEVVRLNSVKDIVARTGLSRSTVYQEMDSGRLRSVKVGRRRLITESALVDYIEGLAGAGTRAEVPQHA